MSNRKIIYLDDAIDAVRMPDITGTWRGALDLAVKALQKLPPAQSETCVYWDRESNFCALHRPFAQSEIICCEDCKYSDTESIADGRYWCHINRAFMYYCSSADKKC